MYIWALTISQALAAAPPLSGAVSGLTISAKQIYHPPPQLTWWSPRTLSHTLCSRPSPAPTTNQVFCSDCRLVFSMLPRILVSSLILVLQTNRSGDGTLVASSDDRWAPLSPDVVSSFQARSVLGDLDGAGETLDCGLIYDAYSITIYQRQQIGSKARDILVPTLFVRFSRWTEGRVSTGDP